MTYENERFINQELTVDGNIYNNCHFENCVLMFQGGDNPVFNNCTFQNIKVQLKGQAAQTANYLSSLMSSGLPQQVENVLGDVRSGFMLLPDRPSPPPAVNTGTHYGRLALYAGIAGIFVLWFFGMYVYSSVARPYWQLQDGEPLIREVSFDLIPALPDSLSAEYDRIRDEQLAQLSQIGVSEEGGVTIPVNDAIEQMLASGAFPVGSSDTDEATSDTESASEDEENATDETSDEDTDADAESEEDSGS